MPNNLNIHSYRSFSHYGITIAFFAIQLSKLVLVKTLLLLDCIENLCYEEIVWRQLELAFFGAVTLVAALFVFGDLNAYINFKEYIMKKAITLFIVATMVLSLVFSLTACLDDTSNSTNKNSSQNSSSENDGTTMGERMALSSAKNYLRTMGFSKKGLIKQLEFEGYSTEEATYAVNNCGADWKEQAVRVAKDYLNTMSFSKQGLIDQLEFEGFTSEEAAYGAEQAYQ